jgi:hypothetical protein
MGYLGKLKLGSQDTANNGVAPGGWVSSERGKPAEQVWRQVWWNWVISVSSPQLGSIGDHHKFMASPSPIHRL